MAAALKTVYKVPTQAVAEAALDAFEAGPWGRKYPTIEVVLDFRTACQGVLWGLWRHME